MMRKKQRYMAEAAGVAAFLSIFIIGWQLWNAASYQPSVMDGYESVDVLQRTVIFGGSAGTLLAVGALWLAGIVLTAFICYQIRSRLGSKSRQRD